MTLIAYAIGDVITEFYGPRTGVNYGGSNPAYVASVLEGNAGAVKVQYNISPLARYIGTNLLLVPDSAQWVDVATITAQGLTKTVITVRAAQHWLRVVCSTAGTFGCTAGGDWAKR